MIKEILKEKEPTVYLSLYNDLKTNHLSHSYLFTGETNPLKIKTAFLLAQSIIERNNDFACETCNTCRRIEQGKYYDVIYINGYKESIKKEDIEKLFKEFNRTALEESGKKIYIISNINNSSSKVLNMILKFMEEPTNDNTYGIFITDDVDRLLPTILSRSKRIPFITRDYSEVIHEYLSNGFEEDDAYLIAHLLHSFNVDFDLNDPIYQMAKDGVYKTIDTLDCPDNIPALFFKELYTITDKDKFNILSNYYLEMMSIMLEDAISNNFMNHNQYDYYLHKLMNVDITKLIEIFAEAKNKASTKMDKKLLFDQIAYKIISYIK